ncbi:MAG: D-alanyl-D-alanine carboxypeptidase/D-alanyl-D-alanine-endopeptidase [FCB group bacterium]|jgi:D-alanyl-D-alanine carboxypeptidase
MRSTINLRFGITLSTAIPAVIIIFALIFSTSDVFAKHKRRVPAKSKISKSVQVKIKTSKSLHIKTANSKLVTLNLKVAKDTSVSKKIGPLTSQDSMRAIAKLKSGIENILAGKGLRKSKSGLAVYSITQKKFYFTKDITQPLTPASTTKLFTSFIAYNTMGGDYQVKTSIYTDAQKIDDSVLNGNLYILGHGDALLSIPDIEALSDEVAKKGIKKINGNIYADGTFYDSLYMRQWYAGDKEEVEPMPPITALSLEKNTATIIAYSSPKVKSPVNVQIVPASEAFRVCYGSQGVSKEDKTTEKAVPKTELKVKKSILKQSVNSKKAIVRQYKKKKNIPISKSPKNSKSLKKINIKSKAKINAKTSKAATKAKISAKSKSAKKTPIASNKSKAKILPLKKNIKKISTDNFIYNYFTQKFGDCPPAPAPVKSKHGKQGKKGKRLPPLKVSSTCGVDNIQNIIVTGSVQPNRTYSFKYFIKHPDLVTAGALKERLKAGGIEINGKIGIQQLPQKDSNASPLLLAEFRRPLVEIVYYTLKNSDNYLAENLFKMTGGYLGNHQNNAQKAIEARNNCFEKYKIPFKNCFLHDGSGLCRRNLITAEALIRILENAYSSPFYKKLDTCLSIAGVDGTLKKRMNGTLAENNLHAKTGTLRNVSGLTGYVRTQDGELLAFAFVFNGPNVGLYKKAEDEIGKLLAGFSYR